MSKSCDCAGKLSSSQNEHPDGMKNLSGKAERGEWNGFNHIVRHDGRSGGLAYQSGKTGWREFF